MPTETLRNRQIREILDEDLRANRALVDRTFRMVRAYDESVRESSPLEELVSWNIDKQISFLQASIQNVIDGAINGQNMTIANEDISKIATAYNLLVSYMNNFAKSHRLNQRDKGQLDMKFAEVEPLLKQLRQILSNPSVFSVDISAQNLDVVNHIEQQIRDSNYRGLSVVDYRKIPVSKATLQRATNYRGYPRGSPARSRPPARIDDDEEGDDDDDNFGTRLRTNDLVSHFRSREGTPYRENVQSQQTPATPTNRGFFTPPSTRDLQLSLSSLKSRATPRSDQSDANIRPLSTPDVRVPSLEAITSSKGKLRKALPLLPDGDESIQRVSTLGQTEGSPFLKTKIKPAPPASGLSPLHRLPPPLPAVLFNKAPKGFATVDGKRVLDDDGNVISQLTWGSIPPSKKDELVRNALQNTGKGRRRRGKKHYEPIQESAVLYDPDDNNLWA